MASRRVFIVVALAVLIAALPARAEVKIAVGHNDSAQAAGAHKFSGVPSPFKDDAAAKARFTIVDGARDGNAGDVNKLNDGRLPDEEDQPDENFFFRQGTDGGRLQVDLNAVISIKQINTYSWHPDTRGPQVYKLYASNGTANDFNATPQKGADPEKCGWKLIGAVDTRPKQSQGGGQYGVSISDSAGAIGKYRYLLFDISRTENDDGFGNTFYSEIDVINEAAPPVVSAAATADATSVAATSPAASGEYEIVIDYSEMPELKDWVEAKLRPTLQEWYPIIVKSLPSEGYTAPKRFTVTFRKDMRGVAATGGTRVVCAGAWFKQNLQGEAAGAVVHELVHVAQQYRGRGNPGWLVEGVADYLRWFKYEKEPAGTRPNPARSKYTDSYRTTAGFLNYIAKDIDKDIIARINAAMRQGKYSPDLWKEYTGKTVDELWEAYLKTVQK